MVNKLILTELRGRTLLLTVNRPSVLNALNQDVLNALAAAFDDALQNANVMCIVLTGAGEKAFVAGADIAEMPTLTEAQTLKMSRATHDIFHSVESSTKPVIAAVNGFALGGGLELAMACHIRLASENAKFGLPEIKLGLIPGYGGTQRLPKLVGSARALQMMLTGEMITAQQAMSYGLVNAVYPQAELMAKTLALTEQMETYSALAMKHMLQAVRAGQHQGDGGYEAEAQLFARSMISQDGREGTTAFIEKRKPAFTGQ